MKKINYKVKSEYTEEVYNLTAEVAECCNWNMTESNNGVYAECEAFIAGRAFMKANYNETLDSMLDRFEEEELRQDGFEILESDRIKERVELVSQIEINSILKIRKAIERKKENSLYGFFQKKAREIELPKGRIFTEEELMIMKLSWISTKVENYKEALLGCVDQWLSWHKAPTYTEEQAKEKVSEDLRNNYSYTSNRIYAELHSLISKMGKFFNNQIPEFKIGCGRRSIELVGKSEAYYLRLMNDFSENLIRSTKKEGGYERVNLSKL